MKAKDYNSINWSEHFFLDVTSPSGLSWARNTYRGIGRKALYKNRGDIAGNKQYNKKGSPHAWRITLEGESFLSHRIIWSLLNGGILPDLVVDHLDGNPFNNSHDNRALKTHKANNQNTKQYSNNTSGIVGVTLDTKCRGAKIYEYWSAQWALPSGKRTNKRFSIDKYGYDQAKALATAYRVEQIQLLNSQGQDYTERHTSSIQAPLHTGLTPATPPTQPT